MARKARPKSRKVNPVARGLRSRALAPRIVKPKRGKGSYSRKGRRAPEEGTEPGAE